MIIIIDDEEVELRAHTRCGSSPNGLPGECAHILHIYLYIYISCVCVSLYLYIICLLFRLLSALLCSVYLYVVCVCVGLAVGSKHSSYIPFHNVYWSFAGCGSQSPPRTCTRAHALSGYFLVYARLSVGAAGLIPATRCAHQHFFEGPDSQYYNDRAPGARMNISFVCFCLHFTAFIRSNK